MNIVAVKLLGIAAAAAVLSLGACQQRAQDAELAKIDNQITGKDADPALTSALEDQILVDPALTQQSNKNAVRPPETPTQAQYPLPEQRRGQVQGRGAGGDARAQGIVDCGPKLEYSTQWARSLPAAFSVYPGAKLTDAAGSDLEGCKMRVVTFTTSAPAERVLEHYRSRAGQAGYSAEHQMREGDHILSGSRSGSDSAFYLILTPKGGGSEVALIASEG